MKQVAPIPVRWSVVFLLAACLATPVLAQVYQWKDAKGHTVISDSPPPATVKQKQTVESRSPQAEDAQPTERTYADQEKAYQQRQKAAKDLADKENKEKQAAADKKENCLRAQRYQATLQSGAPMANYDAKGQPQLIDDTQRQKELERARKSVESWCN